MPPARILSRPEHNVSRKNIDPDALKVLYRLKNHGYTAYLVGGGVRDLLLEGTPKDFDISTSAHPHAVKRLFRNCFIVGRRFRLCHVRFGRKVIEVSTFRKQAPAADDDGLVRRDNTFGTPEEDAFRRDLTVNALFYDIATFSVIDYCGGLEDVERKLIRTIGDPMVRFQEDPVRMFRAVSLASRLGFSIDRDSLEAIRSLRGEIAKSSPPRLLEEMYKVLRQGAARRTFETLHEVGLLSYLLPEAAAAIEDGAEPLLGSLARLDAYRHSGLAAPQDISNSVLMGTLLVPLGVPLRRVNAGGRGARARTAEVDAELAKMDALEPEEPAPLGPPPPVLLPFARRDLETLRLVLGAQRRLREEGIAPGAKKALAGRGYFGDALRWLEIHGGVEAQELAAEWRLIADELGVTPKPRPPRRRRRRRAPRRDGEGGKSEEGGQ